MRTNHPYVTSTGAIALLLLFTANAHALDTDVFLKASVVEQATASTSSLKDVDEMAVTSTQEDKDTYFKNDRERSEVWASLRVLFETLKRSDTELSDRAIQASVAQVRMRDIGDSWVIFSWPRNTFTNIKVYYATTSPVTISNQTDHVSPWMFWNREKMTLRGLSPNTTYFYRVVTETSTSTTTLAEASFRTLQK